MNPYLEEPASLLSLAQDYVLGGVVALREKALSLEATNPEVIMFVVFNTLKSLFLEASGPYTGIHSDQWNHGRCPVCGGQPAVAFMVGEGGRRSLVCHRCEAHWRFRRLTCPFCEYESPGESRYLFIDEPEYRAMTGHVCDQCKCYIKTWRVDDDELGPLHPEVEDLMTPAFDAAMEGENYFRGGPNIFGILMGAASERDISGESRQGK